MKVLVLTIGTRGDVQPLIALAGGLAARGHAVTVCTSVRYADVVARCEVRFAPLSDDLVALVETPEGRRTIAGTGGVVSRLRGASDLVGRSLQIQRELFRDGWAVAREFEPDVILCHPKMLIGIHYAERLSIPALVTPLFPLFDPTSAYPAPGLPSLRFDRRTTALYNRISHHALKRTIGLASRWLFASWRTSVGLPRLPLFADVLQRADGATVPLLNGWSRHVVPEPEDSRLDARRTAGFWFLERDDAWQPDERLRAFLERGDRPVFIGFGSMSGTDPARTTDLVLAALDRVGLRGVLATGWGGLQAEELPETALMLGEAPHDWLFERVSAVVHHGGAGTTAAGLRAGRPSVICPFFGDQPFWAERVRELGAGPSALPQRRLNADRLAAAIRESVDSDSILNKAASVGRLLRNENGIAMAVEFIERMAESVTGRCRRAPARRGHIR